ncbi:MAG: aldo/keto reductase [Proteobacteria bacterium]|nr:aldo/keto reductase [Pseudomonadota bacterium]
MDIDSRGAERSGSFYRRRLVGAGFALPWLLAAAGARPASGGGLAAGTNQEHAMQTRPIPATGEPLPVIGCGTYVGFDVEATPAALAPLAGVLDALWTAGGTVVDSSPMYGRAEAAVGALIDTPAKRKRTFLATKVWTTGRAAGVRQMEASFAALRTEVIDLMQIHNLVDWRTHLPVLREWKAAGRIRYIGITHYTASAYRELEAVMRTGDFDFVQVNYSADERDAAARILPLAAERKMAVLVNRPFGGGGLLRSLVAKPLPAWAPDIGAASWADVLLQYVLSQPAVTCAIPGTGSAAHMAANARAGVPKPPPPAFWDTRLRDIVG